MILVDLKGRFKTEEIYRLYAPCMYEPTWDKYCKKANRYTKDERIHIWGLEQDHKITAVIVIELQPNNMIELLGISVDPTYRRQRMAYTLVQYAKMRFNPCTIYAETDEDAVSFYQHSGFYVEKQIRTFPDGECVRYHCWLS